MLSGYMNESLGLAEEHATSVSETEIDAIRGWIEQYGVQRWRSFCADNSAQIHAYVRATPSQRSRSKTFATLQPLIALAAYQHCVKAAALLDAAGQLQRGPSYRAMAADAGRLFDAMQGYSPDQDVPWDWPWEWGDNPFDEDEDD